MPRSSRQGSAQGPRRHAEAGAPLAAPGADSPLRAVGYLRVSTGIQADRGMGLEVQRRAVQDFAGAHGYALIDIVEEAASGGVKDGETFSWEHRPALLALLEKARTGSARNRTKHERNRAFDAVLVARFDRLSRDFASLVVVERMLATHGVHVVSASESNGETDEADLLRHTLAGFADYERKLINRRLASGKSIRRSRGRHTSGRIPYGYASERATDGGFVFTPIDELAEIVARIFRDAKEGTSPGKIARSLNDEGLPSPAGSRWTSKAVERIVANLVYTGEQHGRKRAHAPLVTRQLFNQANAALEARRQAWASARERGKSA